MTAAALLGALAPYRPTVEGDELVVEFDPPAGLLAQLEILHTGVRAILSGRKWEGRTDFMDDRLAVEDLDPAKPIPNRVTHLRVEGDSRWDRVPAKARTGVPGLIDHPRGAESSRPDDPSPVWDAAAAIALMTAADGLVERLGVCGTDPVIQAAAARVVDAYRACDPRELRHAVGAFEGEVRPRGGPSAPNRPNLVASNRRG
jgi:hypothetical protein